MEGFASAAEQPLLNASFRLSASVPSARPKRSQTYANIAGSARGKVYRG